jgi:hypothetical protein
MSDIPTPHKNDVLMGRGGNNNQHSGNEKLRGVARTRCEDYRRVSKKGKSDISRELIKSVRKWTPPGRCVSTTTMFYHSLSFGLTSCSSHLAHRFLRKDPQTSKWEDVGDDIAREKTSQVLRDAVALQSCPVAKDTNQSYRYQDVVGGSADTSSQRRAYLGQSVVFSQLPDSQSDQTCSRHPYVAYTESMNDISLSGTAPYYPPTVTPASATAGRKRPRYYESLVPAAYVYPLQHSIIVTNSTPTYMIRSPPQRPQNCRPSPPAYYPAASSVYSGAPSPAIHSHYSPQSSSWQTANQPWVAADLPPYAAPSTVTTNEFDLFNGELLSPEREGAISHFVYPTQHFLKLPTLIL